MSSRSGECSTATQNAEHINTVDHTTSTDMAAGRCTCVLGTAISHQPISALRTVTDTQRDERMSRYDMVVVLVVVGVIVALLIILLLVVAQNG